MNISPDAPGRPALRYYGGKWDLGKWIISYFPPHDHYVEPCFGAGSVLLQKPQVKLETVNDLNGRVTNYFQIMRDSPAELIRAIDLTPWSQDEYKTSANIAECPIEDARRFHILCWMSINGGPVPTGFRTQNSLKSRYATPATDLLKHDLWTVARRLKNVQIVNQEAQDVLKRYHKVKDVLIYFDPPYLPQTRSQKKGYGEYEETVKFHIESAEIINELPGMIIISGYPSELYRDLYESRGYLRVDKEAQVNSGSTKTECLWLSPSIVKYSHLPLFNLQPAVNGKDPA